METFYNNITIRPLFKINDWIYRGILGVLVKKSLNQISFSHIPLGGMKIWGFKGIERNECSLLLIPFPPT